MVEQVPVKSWINHTGGLFGTMAKGGSYASIGEVTSKGVRVSQEKFEDYKHVIQKKVWNYDCSPVHTHNNGYHEE